MAVVGIHVREPNHSRVNRGGEEPCLPSENPDLQIRLLFFSQKHGVNSLFAGSLRVRAVPLGKIHRP